MVCIPLIPKGARGNNVDIDEEVIKKEEDSEDSDEEETKVDKHVKPKPIHN